LERSSRTNVTLGQLDRHNDDMITLDMIEWRMCRLGPAQERHDHPRTGIAATRSPEHRHSGDTIVIMSALRRSLVNQRDVGAF
jgi:hypothetical protein